MILATEFGQKYFDRKSKMFLSKSMLDMQLGELLYDIDEF